MWAAFSRLSKEGHVQVAVSIEFDGHLELVLSSRGRENVGEGTFQLTNYLPWTTRLLVLFGQFGHQVYVRLWCCLVRQYIICFLRAYGTECIFGRRFVRYHVACIGVWQSDARAIGSDLGLLLRGYEGVWERVSSCKMNLHQYFLCMHSGLTFLTNQSAICYGSHVATKISTADYPGPCMFIQGYTW